MVRRCGFWIGGRFCEDIYTFEAANRVYQESFFPQTICKWVLIKYDINI